MLLLVPFVDTMTTMLNEKLPLTPAEWELWGNPIESKEYFEYIYSYSPYNNLDNKSYPSMLITTSLFDNRVLYSEPVKYIARLQDKKTDNSTNNKWVAVLFDKNSPTQRFLPCVTKEDFII